MIRIKKEGRFLPLREFLERIDQLRSHSQKQGESFLATLSLHPCEFSHSVGRIFEACELVLDLWEVTRMETKGSLTSPKWMNFWNGL